MITHEGHLLRIIQKINLHTHLPINVLTIRVVSVETHSNRFAALFCVEIDSLLIT